MTDARALAERPIYGKGFKRGVGGFASILVGDKEYAAEQIAKAADLLDRLAASEGVGLTRYDIRHGNLEEGELIEVLDQVGEWVRHDDAAAALAGRDRANRILLAERDAAEAQVATLKEALERVKAMVQREEHTNRIVRRIDAALSTLPPPAASGEG